MPTQSKKTMEKKLKERSMHAYYYYYYHWYMCM